MKFQQCFYVLLVAVCLLLGCSPYKFIGKEAQAKVIKNKNLQTAHIGISIYDATAGRYLYDYEGDKYFVPASNVKLATCYAAMKYLGDSLAGLRIGYPEEKGYRDKVIVLKPTGDPSFLHPDFIKQPVFDFLNEKVLIKNRQPVFLADSAWQDERWGNGWAWNDYQDDYMAERNSFPIYGNVVHISLNDIDKRIKGFHNSRFQPEKGIPVFKTQNRYFDSIVNQGFKYRFQGEAADTIPNLSLHRDISENIFKIRLSKNEFKPADIPFVTDDFSTTLRILSNNLKKEFWLAYPNREKFLYYYEPPDGDVGEFHIKDWHTLHSQPTDSLLKSMMHRSDNFFAEQTLLMVSNERIGLMSDEKIIDTLLKTDLANLPQQPHWVDGSGLSRYNLFTPQDFVTILNRMRADFGIERLKNILPTGGQGTLANYFRADSSFLWAKTGTLSGVVALSGFMYTRKGRLLLFSVQVNNHVTSGTNVRRAVESFIQEVRRRL